MMQFPDLFLTYYQQVMMGHPEWKPHTNRFKIYEHSTPRPTDETMLYSTPSYMVGVVDYQEMTGVLYTAHAVPLHQLDDESVLGYQKELYYLSQYFFENIDWTEYASAFPLDDMMHWLNKQLVQHPTDEGANM